MAKFIFVTGGVVSSLGKGVTAASIGLLLKKQGFEIRHQKLDPYINVDPGTMNPFEHGEVYVTDDGAETDLDLGHYERYTGVPTRRASNYTTGQIYESVIRKERTGDFLGRTVQVIPHITDEIKASIRNIAEPGVRFVITEIGGTVGDIESLPFLEAIRQIRNEEDRADTLVVHVSLVPFIKAAGELKTKPTQHSVMKLREIGIQPDIICCRGEQPLTESARKKLSLFCNVPPEHVIDEPDVQHSIYEVPGMLMRQNLDRLIGVLMRTPGRHIDLSDWDRYVARFIEARDEVEICLVGKYTENQDAYKSIDEALVHAGVAVGCRAKIRDVRAEDIEARGTRVLEGGHGILVPGGFGKRGMEGKILAARYAREQRVPYFGICMGMQIAAIEFARNVLGLAGANSQELDPETAHPVIAMLDEQKKITRMGGTMRLGAYPCELTSGSRAAAAYGTSSIRERHRHRYEFNDDYRDRFQKAGMVVSGVEPGRNLVEVMELKDHPWFLGCQYHPEFKSRPTDAHPLFRAFVQAAYDQKRSR